MPALYFLNANTLDIATAIVVEYTLTNTTKENKMSDTKKVDSLIAEDGFTVSRKDLVLVDGYEMCVEEMWSDGTVFVAFGHGEEKEVTIEDLDSRL